MAIAVHSFDITAAIADMAASQRDVVEDEINRSRPGFPTKAVEAIT